MQTFSQGHILDSFKPIFILYYFYYCTYMYSCIMSDFNKRILLLLAVRVRVIMPKTCNY